MLSEKEAEALRRWYRQEHVLEESRRLIAGGEWHELEEHLHMRCLIPVHRHSELPDYMLDDEGKPLFPGNLNPKNDLERWQDAVEVGWAVVEERFGLTHEDVLRKKDAEGERDWADFVRRFEARQRERGEG